MGKEGFRRVTGSIELSFGGDPLSFTESVKIISRRKRCVDALEEQHKGMRQIERALGKKAL